MALAEALRAIQRLEDLPALAAALGYPPAWGELPDGCLPGAVRAVMVGHQDGFGWYGAEGEGPECARRGARALAARGIAAAVFVLDAGRRRLAVAAGPAAGIDLALDAPEPLALARLARASARPGELPLAAAFRIAEALGGRGVDERFFAAFRKTLGRIMDAMPRLPIADRHALGLLQLTRILFLYFVEARGWLAGRPRFLREEVDRTLAARRSLHRDLLDPLFFGTLNRPFAERSRLARRFGRVPFLNGGLFEPHPLERRWKVSLPTPVLRDAFDSLFERFHFTLSPGSAESVAPDMLGRAFEGVMEPAERHATGSYYTPAALVDALLADALSSWLAEQLAIPWREARARLDEPDGASRRALRQVRLLDPAVGSGAFLLGALRLLAGARQSGRGRAVRAVLGGCLFGVDRNAAAVRLAELRLWLEVVAADPGEEPEQAAPLPNLDAMVRQGDSLIDPGVGIPLPPALPAEAAALRRLRREVVHASGRSKAAAVAALNRAERAVASTGLRRAIGSLDRKIEELLAQARTPTLFGERRGLSRTDGLLLGSLRGARRESRGRLRSLKAAREVPWFHYPTHFADIFARGGFDLVVGNPPWVRAEALPPDFRRHLAERFEWFRRGPGAERGYAHPPDLAVAFVERSLELLRAGGIAALLVPAKLATTGYAAAARAALASRTTVLLAADLRRDPRASFDATVYPMALAVRKGAASPGHEVRLGLGEGAPVLPQRTLDAGPWLLRDPGVREVLARLAAGFPTLAASLTCHLGVKTGLNRAFLDPPPDIEAAVVRWAVRGRDVAAFACRPRLRILWPCDGAGRPIPGLPPRAAAHLAPYLGDLARRADQAEGPPWTLFRTGPASAPYRVVWADVARELRAAALVGADGGRLIPLNSCYVAPTRTGTLALRIAAWLNSTWVRAAARALADPASGDFARFNARVVGALPLPPAALDDDVALELGRRGAAGREVQPELDQRCAELLELSPTERRALAGLARPGA